MLAWGKMYKQVSDVVVLDGTKRILFIKSVQLFREIKHDVAGQQQGASTHGHWAPLILFFFLPRSRPLSSSV
jgi:hypothetical protein